MKAFISAVYLTPNSVSQEKICVGLIAVNSEGQVFFEKSDGKIKLANKLMKEDITASIVHSLKLIGQKVEEANQAASKLFVQNFFNVSYFTYLNQYSQGLLQFMEPKPFAGSIGQLQFNCLFEAFVGEKVKEKAAAPIRKTSVKQRMQQQLKRLKIEKADIIYEVPAHKVPSVYVPVKVDLISKNGCILTANGINFNERVETITEHLQEYTSLAFGIDKLSTEYDLKGPKHYLITEAPEKGSDQYEIYQSIKNDKHSPFTLSTLDRLTEIEQKLQQENYGKFSEFIEGING